jgi:hypothetical protein
MMWQGRRDWNISLVANHLQGRRWDPGFVTSLRTAGAVSYVHTTDDKARGQMLWDRRTGMYTNVLFPPFESSPAPAPTSPGLAALTADEG